jgi:hypothetical protein
MILFSRAGLLELNYRYSTLGDFEFGIFTWIFGVIRTLGSDGVGPFTSGIPVCSWVSLLFAYLEVIYILINYIKENV